MTIRFVLFLVLPICASPTNLENCVKTILNIQSESLLTTNCCLTKLCSNHFYIESLHNHPAIKELTHKLCAENFYLLREQLNGCRLQTVHLNNVNKNTNYVISANKGDVVTVKYRTLLKKNKTDPQPVKHKKLMADASATRGQPQVAHLQFFDVPNGDEMQIQNLMLDKGYLFFGIFSTLVGYLQLDEFPLGLARDWLQNPVPLYIAAYQLLKMEIPVLVWICLWTMLTLCVLLITATHFCNQTNSIQRLQEESSIVSLNLENRCTENTLVFLLHFFLILLLVPIITILGGNEQISRCLTHAISTTNLVFDDLETFIRNTHMQITFVATSSTDVAIEAINKDMEQVEELLGRPYRADLAAETGLENALVALNDVQTATGSVTVLVSDLLDECNLATAAENLLQSRLSDIFREITMIRQQCLPKDRPLCYTIQCTGLEMVFSCHNLTLNPKIKHLKRLASDKSFNNTINNARITFSRVPEQVALETAHQFTEIKSLINRQRTEVYKTTHYLDELSTSLLQSVSESRNKTLVFVESVVDWELWRWIAVVGICTILFFVWGILFCGAPCGCGPTSRTKLFLLSGVMLSTLICLLLCTLGTLSFLIGGHGLVFFCQPLYDQPHFTILSKLLDTDGVLYGGKGFLQEFERGNDSLKISDVLMNCERNYVTYGTFHLENIFDLKSTHDHHSSLSLQMSLSNLSIDNQMVILRPSLQLNLQILSTISDINLSKYREKFSKPLTKRDLNSFADHLDTVARQLSDLESSKRIINLALLVKSVVHNEVNRLDHLRDNILYKITALDVLMQPLSQRANQSLHQLKAVQYFLDNNSWQIAEKNCRSFASRLEAHLDALYAHASQKIGKEIGKCRPLWQMLQTSRFHLCKLLVDPLNAISLSSYFAISVFLGIVLVVVKLLEHYKYFNEELLSFIAHRLSTDQLITNETWATPASSESLPDVEMGNIGQERPIVHPPRLSMIASRISATRVPQIPSVSRARTPKRGRHESLRLIDPIYWKSKSPVPRSWL